MVAHKTFTANLSEGAHLDSDQPENTEYEGLMWGGGLHTANDGHLQSITFGLLEGRRRGP